MRKRLLLLPCILLLSALALTACGGGSGEDGEIEEVVETSATTNQPADCKKLNTQQFMEQTTKESGKAALTQCEEEAKKGEGAKSVGVSGVTVDGSDATAEAAMSGGNLDGQTLEVALVKKGDQWKMNEVVKFTEFDHDQVVKGLEKSFSEADPSELSPQFAKCVIQAFKKGSQKQIEELLFSKAPGPLEKVLEGCASKTST